MSKPEVKIIDLREIRIDGGTQQRAKIHEDVVQEYYELLEAGQKLPPIDVYWDGKSYWLADGFHRYWAEHKWRQEVVRLERELDTLKKQGVMANAITPLTFPTFSINPQLDDVTPGPKDPEHHQLKRLSMFIGRLSSAVAGAKAFPPDQFIMLTYSPGSRWTGLHASLEKSMTYFKELEGALTRYDPTPEAEETT